MVTLTYRCHRNIGHRRTTIRHNPRFTNKGARPVPVAKLVRLLGLFEEMILEERRVVMFSRTIRSRLDRQSRWCSNATRMTLSEFGVLIR